MNQAEINNNQVDSASAAERQSRWVAASLAAAATTGGLVAILYLASAIGWTIEGRAPASGWVAIVAGVVAGAVAGGVAIGIQRRRAMPRIAAPIIGSALIVIMGILAWVAAWPFDTNGSARYGLAVIVPFAVILISLGTTIVAFTRPALWRGLSIIGWAMILVASLVGLLPTI
ncbi:hypothetical protein [Microbacterium lacticum]|uniref:hypothetical protein n=2 Tax=Microbacteriaceae TaxID=85023 RepID=UPI0028D4755E|nr:hypothetical protein [Microbacterium lacticum]